jgi:hypothetical protein
MLSPAQGPKRCKGTVGAGWVIIICTANDVEWCIFKPEAVWHSTPAVLEREAWYQDVSSSRCPG